MSDDTRPEIPPFHDYLGIRVERGEPGECKATIELQAHHLNRRGVAHGGVVTSLLDTALGGAVIAAIPREWWCATISLQTQFVAGGCGRLTATGRLLRRGLRVAYAAGEVRDERDRLVAVASGSWHLWPHRPDRPGETARHGRVVVRDTGESLRVGKIVCAGRNYAAHVAEMGAAAGEPPVFFIKPSSALTCGDGTVSIPTTAGAVHHEVELVAVIGTPGREIEPARALEHVMGWAVGLDMTLRDVQSEAKKRGEPWALAKGFDGSAPVSLVTPAEETGDVSGLAISLEVNGELRQQGDTSQMLTPVPGLIAHASRWMTLERGDLVFTGTPSGVGPLSPGDRVVARIERVGTLELTVEGER